MTRHVLLNNIAHKNLRVITRYGAPYGDFTGTVATFITEFGDVQREYPILFRKDSKTGEFMAVALLGLQSNENLFLDGDRWSASYVPGLVARGPFFIGFQEREEGGEMRREPVLHVDMDDPRVSETEGEPLFLEQGGQSPYLQRVATVLKGLSEGLAVNPQMFAALNAMNLIEPVGIEVKVSEAERYDLQGFYTISAEKLAALDAESLFKLNKSGFLFAAFLVVSSLNNVRKLIDLKVRRRQAASASGSVAK
jgi:hypothetical protein